MNGPDRNESPESAAMKAFAKPFAGILKIVPDTGTPVWIDGRTCPPSVSTDGTRTGNMTPGCIWHGKRRDIVDALKGEEHLVDAFISGRVTISGDMSIMARLEMEQVS